MAKALSIFSQNPIYKNFYPSVFDQRKHTNKEIHDLQQISQERPIGFGYSGKSIEINWIKGILKSIQSKTKKLNKNYTLYEKNWLLINDQQVRIDLDREYIRNELTINLVPYWNYDDKRKFDIILILSADYLYMADNKNGVREKERPTN
jgi:hypothetical protein